MIYNTTSLDPFLTPLRRPQQLVIYKRFYIVDRTAIFHSYRATSLCTVALLIFFLFPEKIYNTSAVRGLQQFSRVVNFTNLPRLPRLYLSTHADYTVHYTNDDLPTNVYEPIIYSPGVLFLFAAAVSTKLSATDLVFRHITRSYGTYGYDRKLAVDTSLCDHFNRKIRFSINGAHSIERQRISRRVLLKCNQPVIRHRIISRYRETTYSPPLLPQY